MQKVYVKGQWKPILMHRIVTRGAKKGWVEITYPQSKKGKTIIVHSSKTRGLPEFSKEEQAKSEQLTKLSQRRAKR